ncbi:unnamed protein product, partial [Prunus brigantina]
PQPATFWPAVCYSGHQSRRGRYQNDRAGTKMTGPPSSSYPSQAPPPAAGISPENRREKLGFARNLAGFVLRRPASIFGNQGSSIYELKFGRFCDRDSGHFRSVFGVLPGSCRIRRIVKWSPGYSENANPRSRLFIYMCVGVCFWIVIREVLFCDYPALVIAAFYVVESSMDYNILLGRDWIHQAGCIPSSLFQLLFFWDGQKVSIHPADEKPFETNAVQARIYDDDVGWVVLTGHDANGRPTRTTAQKVLELGAENARQDSAREVLIDLTSR